MAGTVKSDVEGSSFSMRRQVLLPFYREFSAAGSGRCTFVRRQVDVFLCCGEELILIEGRRGVGQCLSGTRTWTRAWPEEFIATRRDGGVSAPRLGRNH